MKRIKRTTAVVLCVLLLCAGFPAVVQADEIPYALWIGGRAVTSWNAADMFGDGTVTFDAETNTLTITDLEVTEAADGDPGDVVDYGCIYSNLPTLTIRLVGENNLYAAYDTNGHYNQAISTSGDLIFEGEGSLTATSGEAAYSSVAIYAIGDIYFNGTGTVRAVAETEGLQDNVFGVQSQNGTVHVSATATDGVVEARGATAAFAAFPDSAGRVAYALNAENKWQKAAWTAETVSAYKAIQLRNAYYFSAQPKSGSALNGTAYSLSFSVADSDGKAVTPTKTIAQIDRDSDDTFSTSYVEVNGSPFAAPSAFGEITLDNTAYWWRLCAEIGSGGDKTVLYSAPFTVAFKPMETLGTLSVTVNGFRSGITPKAVTYTVTTDLSEAAAADYSGAWYRKNDGGSWTAVGEDETFKEQGVYRLDMQVTIAGGYQVSAATVGTVNGTETGTVYRDSGDTAYLSHTFDSLPIRQVMASVAIQVDTPTIGQTVSDAKKTVQATAYNESNQAVTTALTPTARFFRCKSYSQTDSSWTTMAETDTFEAGVYYAVDVNVYGATDGLTRFSDSVTVTVNGIPGNTAFGEAYVNDEQVYAFYQWDLLPDGSQPLSQVDVQVTTPKIDAFPNYMATLSPADGTVQITNLVWYKAADLQNVSGSYRLMQSSEMFEDNGWYACAVTLRAADGYALRMDTVCTVNDRVVSLRYTGRAGEYEACLYFEPLSSKPVLPGFEVTVKEPVVGETPSVYALSDTAHLTVFGFGWKRANPEKSGEWLTMAAGETFREGETYAFYLWVSVNDGYAITPDTCLIINGQRVGVSTRINDSVVLMRSFTVSAASVVVPGDANEDGNVDMKDVLLIRKSIANLGVTVSRENADANGDGSVDMKDVLLIRKYIAKLISSLG